jgi:hypothetical protein
MFSCLIISIFHSQFHHGINKDYVNICVTVSEQNELNERESVFGEYVCVGRAHLIYSWDISPSVKLLLMSEKKALIECLGFKKNKSA